MSFKVDNNRLFNLPEMVALLWDKYKDAHLYAHHVKATGPNGTNIYLNPIILDHSQPLGIDDIMEHYVHGGTAIWCGVSETGTPVLINQTITLGGEVITLTAITDTVFEII